MHITACPFCGNSDCLPLEDGWSCQDCGREYPTGAFRCPHPDCWEYEISARSIGKGLRARPRRAVILEACRMGAQRDVSIAGGEMSYLGQSMSAAPH